jgi:hypothetical protein
MDYRIEKLKQELEALRGIIAANEDDDQFINDLIEGETSAHETIDRIVIKIQEDQAKVDALGNVISQFQDRKKAFMNKIEAQRATIHKILNLFELPKIETASATISIKRMPPSIVVTDAVAIPLSYWKHEPVLDKKLIKTELLEGKKINGCELSNGGETISIRC